MSAWERLQIRRRKDQNGFVAIFTVICFASFMFGCAALGVDVARWYVEAQRLQRAADAGALGGVSYLPQDFTSATSTAKTISSRNGYTDGSNGVTIQTAQGSKKSELSVTVCESITNYFGAVVGIRSNTICRTAVADFTGPAPMGSPCNTFGNEPSGGGGASSPSPAGTALSGSKFQNCSSNPQLWADIEGPDVDKVQGDRFQTLQCSDTSAGTDGCDSATNNTDYDKAGYFWLVHVQPAAVGQTIDLQLFDPAFVNTGQTCANLPNAGSSGAATINSNSWNDYVNDAKTRYTGASYATATSTGAPTCTGDNLLGGTDPTITSFALRQQTDTLNPLTAAVQSDTSGSTCVRQYNGLSSYPTAAQLQKGNASYNDELSKEFHNWTSFCTFKPTRAGDYYLQVRTDIALGGTNIGTNSLAYKGNDTNVLNSSLANTTAGDGSNAFGIRLVTPSGYENQVSVSSYDKMPIYVNATNSPPPTFNLIRVLPGAAGKAISFSYFDIGDAAGNGTPKVTVTMPTDATNAAGTLTYKPGGSATDAQRFPNGCKAVGGFAGSGATYSDCSARFTGSTTDRRGNTISGSNNGKVETISIPIPNDYTCTYSSLGGCWYQVTLDFGGSDSVHDVTTWTADIVGQPVRLIQ